MQMRRRTFLQGCCAGIVAMSGARLGNLCFAQDGGDPELLISVFLRGGMDALSFLVPHGDAIYHDQRTRLAISSAAVVDLDGYFGLHPSAAPLKEVYDDQHLALISATGIPDDHGTRSHFEAQDFLDYGSFLPSAGGWLGRYLTSEPGGGGALGGLFRGVSMSSAVSTSLYGYNEALALSDVQDFTLRGNSSGRDDIRRALRTMYGGTDALSSVGSQTLDATDLLDANPPGDYTPSPGVTYPDSDFGDTLMALAQLVKLDIGFQAGTVDLGGWDTHESQASYGNPSTGYYADRVADLADGVSALWADLASYQARLTIVVMSEFGRRLKENANTGTDHGHGGVMMVLNSHIRGKRVWGNWPGLSTDQLYERKDLRVTTDWRTVLAEIARNRLRLDKAKLATMFPGFTYSHPVGFLENPIKDLIVIR